MVDLTVSGTTTLLRCRAGAHRVDDVTVGSVPDRAGCRPVHAAVHRVAWVSLDLTGPSPVCRVAGVRRRPVELTVPVAVGLALIDDGAPGLVRTGGVAA